MDLFHLRIFQRHIVDQCHFALAAVPIIESSLLTREHDNLWLGCQQFLVGAANVSKALWGQGGKLADRREPLRKSLGVCDDSPLRSTTFRNHFEHYDNRIDTWWETSLHHNHMDSTIGPPEMYQGIDNQDRFRIYDPTNHKIIFWGQEFMVSPMAEALISLQQVAKIEARKPHWEFPC